MVAVLELCDFSKNVPSWISYPETVQLFAVIEAAGGSCRFVGGCVRDALLGQISDDLDVCTDLRPEKVLETLTNADIKVIPTGLKHGTVTAFIGKRKFEITTLRNDIKNYGRHADVSFTTNWRDDAARRDFTINAMSVDGSGNVHDFFSGKEDLASGIVRFIGNADERIEEDRLRVLRFFRFYSLYGKGNPDKKAIEACRKSAQNLSLLSAERISKELLLLLGHTNPLKSLSLMQETGVLDALLGYEISLGQLEGLLSLQVFSEPINRLGAILEGKQDRANQIANELRLSARQKKRLISMCDASVAVELSIHQQKKRIFETGKQVFKDQVLLSWARSPNTIEFQDFLDVADIWNIPGFPISGQDLLSRGMDAGPEVGTELKRLQLIWIESDYKMTKDQLLKNNRSFDA